MSKGVYCMAYAPLDGLWERRELAPCPRLKADAIARHVLAIPETEFLLDLLPRDGFATFGERRLDRPPVVLILEFFECLDVLNWNDRRNGPPTAGNQYPFMPVGSAVHQLGERLARLADTDTGWCEVIYFLVHLVQKVRRPATDVNCRLEAWAAVAPVPSTELPPRKTFYLDSIEAIDAPGPSLLLAAYGDGTDLDAWRTLDLAADAFGSPNHAAPELFLHEADGYLSQMHGLKSLPKPLGSALRYWGADSRMAGWHYWAVGADSADVKERITQPDSTLPVYMCGEAWSTGQAWIEGAIESAEAVVDRLAG